MTRPDHTEQRLTNLEIKASYTDDLLDTLNDIVARQQDLIDRLRREVHTLREQLDGGTPASPRSLSDDLPPHY
jgi:SlyX protein